MFDLFIGILPYICLLLTIVVFWQKRALSYAFVQASLLWGFFVYTLTFALSIFDKINYLTVLIAWFSYFVFVFILLIKGKTKLAFKWDIYIGFIAFIVLVVCVTGLLYPPNTWDALTYHMPRVEQWIQNHNQAFFYTNIIRQNGMAPFASTIILHTSILAKSDIYANLMQAFAFAGSIYLIICIGKYLGASKVQQYLGAIFFATLPMAILQASSVQTDLAITFWFLCFVYMFLLWIKHRQLILALYAGMALGLAILTKGTAYVVALPFVLYFAYLLLKDIKAYFVHAALICLVVMAINTPHLVRNYNFYGSIIAAGENTIVQKPSIGTFIVNFVGNLRVHEPGIFLKKELDDLYVNLCSIVGVDVQDKGIFPWGFERYSYKMEDSKAQNTLHALALCVIFFLFFRRKLALPKAYTFLSLAVICTFCLLIAWQPWITRLQTPIFALCAPLFGLALQRQFLKNNMISRYFVYIMCIYAFWPLFMNVLRPIIPYYTGYPTFYNSSREELYFAKLPTLKNEYINAATALANKQPEHVALLLGEDSVEYPLWVLLKSRLQKMPNLSHSFPKQLQAKPSPYVFVLSLRAIGTEGHEVGEATQSLREKMFNLNSLSVKQHSLPQSKDMIPQVFELVDDKYIPLQ